MELSRSTPSRAPLPYRRARLTAAVLLALIPAFAVPAIAQEPVPVDFVVALDPDSRDTNYISRADVESLGNTYLVTWMDDYQDISNGTDRIEAALITPDGRFDVQVESFADGGEALGIGNAVATLAPNGGFNVAWSSPETDFESYEVFWRRFSPDATPLGPKSRLNASTEGHQYRVGIATSKDGITLVTWSSSDPAFFGLIGRYLDANGNALGGEFRIQPDSSLEVGGNGNARGGESHDIGGVARALDDGRFVVVWQAHVPPINDTYLARILTPGNLLLGEPFVVTETRDERRGHSVAALEGGGFAVAWIGDGPAGTVVRTRHFDAAGNPEGGEIDVSSPSDDLRSPEVGRGASGESVVAWSSLFLQGNFDCSTFARRVGPSAPIGSIFPLHSSVDFECASQPRVAYMPDGGFIHTWQHESVESNYSLRASRLPADGDLRTGLRAYWRADEASGGVVADLAVGGLAPGEVADDGTLAGADWGDGRIAGGLVFDGSGHVTLAPSVDLDIDTPALTVAGWVRPDLLPSQLSEPEAAILDAVEDNYALFLDRDAAEVRFRITDSDGTVGTVGFSELGRIRAGEWHHLTGVYDGAAGELRLYLAGNLVATHSDPALIDPVRATPAQTPAIGRNGSADEHYFQGGIDDLAVWDRALTDTEIRFLVGLTVFADDFESGGTSAWSLTTSP